MPTECTVPQMPIAEHGTRQEHWNRRYLEMNNPGEMGPRIARNADVVAAGWTFQLAELNARKLGFNKVAETARIMGAFAGANKGLELDLKKPVSTDYGFTQIDPDQRSVHAVLRHIQEELENPNAFSSNGMLLGIFSSHPDNESRISNIYALAGITEDQRKQFEPSKKTNKRVTFESPTNLGVHLVEIIDLKRNGSVRSITLRARTPQVLE